MDDLTIRPATDADLQRLIDIVYDDPPSDIRAVEPDAQKVKAIGALLVRNGLEFNVRLTVVAVRDGRAWAYWRRGGPGKTRP